MSRLQLATRREFVSRGLGLVGVGATLPDFLIRTALAGPQALKGDSVLVVLQLSGGHDGLSAVVPYRNDDYARNRNTTRIAADAVVKIDDQFGFHPGLKGFHDLLDRRQLAVVHGVGYPNPNRSHFVSMDIWHSADTSARPRTTGWIGRFAERNPDPRFTMAVGAEKPPLALQSKAHSGVVLRTPEGYRYMAGRPLLPEYRKLIELGAKEQPVNPALRFVSQTAIDANATSDEILRLSRRRSPAVDYPKTPLAGSLATVASLIAGGLSTRVYYVFHGGYDTHAGQHNRHERLMTELNAAVVAFQKDLVQQGNADRVLTMAFSEFGRRVRENGSQGTDHGTAGPMFLFGPGVKAGLHGKFPSLASADLDQGDLKHQVDFRSVYSAVLEKWLRTPSGPILGGSFKALDCLT